jgi:hypothetical protein
MRRSIGFWPAIKPKMYGETMISDANAKDLNLTERLKANTAELQELEQLVKSGDLDGRVLNEFRNTVDHIRNTTWVVQQWIGAREQSGDPYAVLPALAAQRVRRATQLINDLSLDLQTVDISIETEGLSGLYTAVDDLNRRLELLFKRERGR